mmetsp:Transcript_3094/g.8394  ORF Transcript_3094/g.8394 Transcript_3094/m.8394 type:complete len:87 (-) Transcript_3094:1411-1671(-)
MESLPESRMAAIDHAWTIGVGVHRKPLPRLSVGIGGGRRNLSQTNHKLAEHRQLTRMYLNTSTKRRKEVVAYLSSTADIWGAFLAR